MSLDITPHIPAGRQFIQSYDIGRFKVSGEIHDGPILVFSEETLRWDVTAFEQLSAERLAPVVARAEQTDILLLGCGARAEFVAPDIRDALKSVGIVIEVMDTGAACRTFNVLMTEERRVGAALIPLTEMPQRR